MSASAVEMARPTVRVRGLLVRAEPIVIAEERAVEQYRGKEAFVGIDIAKGKERYRDCRCGPGGSSLLPRRG